MIWATVSSWSCFGWLYRASPSLAAKNIINLILVLAIWWCPCVESSLVLLEEGVCYDQCVLLAKLDQSLPCFILYSKAKFVYYSRCFLTSYFCIPVPYNEKNILFGLPWYWMVCLEMNRDHSIVLENASKYCISDSFVHYDVYSISSKGFLSTVVDIMTI